MDPIEVAHLLHEEHSYEEESLMLHPWLSVIVFFSKTAADFRLIVRA